jgi:hypothetical protein
VIYRPPGSSASGHRLRIVVQSIHRGQISDLNGLQLGADQRGAAPEYVKVEITNLGPGALSDAEGNDGLPDSLMGIDNTGNQQPALTFIVAHGITKVAYTGTQAYVESPVTWKPAT